jgi:hypothetical protein
MTTLAPPAHEGTRDLVANAVRRFRHDTVCGRRLGSARFYSRTFFGPSALALAASTAVGIARVERQRGNRKAPRAPGTQHETDCLANREAGKAGEIVDIASADVTDEVERQPLVPVLADFEAHWHPSCSKTRSNA